MGMEATALALEEQALPRRQRRDQRLVHGSITPAKMMSLNAAMVRPVTRASMGGIVAPLGSLGGNGRDVPEITLRCATIEGALVATIVAVSLVDASSSGMACDRAYNDHLDSASFFL